MKKIILLVALSLFGCSHAPAVVPSTATSYGERLSPGSVSLLVVAVTDVGDSSELANNEFLRLELENKIISSLTSKGFKCIPAGPGAMAQNPSHLLTVAPKPRDKTDAAVPVKMAGGARSAGQMVSAAAVVYQVSPRSIVGQSYASSDGMGLDRNTRMASGYFGGITIKETYHLVYGDAALSLFN